GARRGWRCVECSPLSACSACGRCGVVSMLSGSWFQSLFLLAFFTEDELTLVTNALAFVRLRRTVAADFRRDLADALLVDAGDRQLGLLVDGDRDAGRDRVIDVVAVAELQHQGLALYVRAVADALDLHVPCVALLHALDGVADQAPRR